jgi:hypothetical protein
MEEIKTETLPTDVKWFSDNVNEKDASKLNDFIALRKTQGWEYVSHQFVKGSIFSIRGKFLVTFKRKYICG